MSGQSKDPECCQWLDWDSDFFGFGVAQVESKILTQALCYDIERWCQRNNVSCLYFAAAADDLATMRLAEAFGYQLVDVRILLHKSLGTGELPTALSPQVRRSRAEDLPTLKALSRGAFTDSRFYYDEHIPAHLRGELYARWVETSHLNPADAVLVWEQSGVVMGYVTCHPGEAGTGAKIGLLAVGHQFRRSGVGGLLLDAAVAWFYRASVDRVSVVTQARNIVAQRLYQRRGFLVENVSLYYHKWRQMSAG